MSQWFFSMRTPKPGRTQFEGRKAISPKEREALWDALNPFARENKSQKIIDDFIQRDINAFMEDRPSTIGDVIAGRVPPLLCGTCDECVFRATGVYPDRNQTFFGHKIHTDCRMQNGLIEFKPLPDSREVERQWASATLERAGFFKRPTPTPKGRE